MPAYGTFKYGEGKYGAGWQFPFTAVVGPYRGHRFTMFMNESGQTQMHDKILDVNESIYLRYLKMGMIMKFDLTMDHIMLYSPLIDDLQDSDNSLFYLAYQNTGEDFLQLRGADFYDGKDIRWDIGLIPFQTSELYKLASAANVNNEAGTSSLPWPELGAICYIDSNGTDDMHITMIISASGSYRAYFLMACDPSETEDARIYTSGARIDGSLDIVDGFTYYDTGHDWFYIDFIADEVDIIEFHVKSTSVDGGAIIWGELVLFPLANSKNFPLDIREQGLRKIDIDESAI